MQLPANSPWLSAIVLSSADVAHAAGARSASALGLAGDAWLGVAKGKWWRMTVT